MTLFRTWVSFRETSQDSCMAKGRVLFLQGKVCSHYVQGTMRPFRQVVFFCTQNQSLIAVGSQRKPTFFTPWQAGQTTQCHQQCTALIRGCNHYLWHIRGRQPFIVSKQPSQSCQSFSAQANSFHRSRQRGPTILVQRLQQAFRWQFRSEHPDSHYSSCILWHTQGHSG